ncbi:hypothetical protein M0R45_002460 [Rubus argutus]|uniref:Uncharacterized protein n=1 Tax=Rubus argutus TaxID=59490 RepID=A0AAW1VRM1_RUBAR
MLNVEAVRNVPIDTMKIPYEIESKFLLVSLLHLVSLLLPPREPTPPLESTPLLDEPIVSYKRKHSESATSSKKKAPRKYMRIDEIEDQEPIRPNPYSDLNPLFECHSNGSDDDISDDSLDDDFLVDEDDEFEA